MEAASSSWALNSCCHVDLEHGSQALTESQAPDPGQLSPSYRREEELEALLVSVGSTAHLNLNGTAEAQYPCFTSNSGSSCGHQGLREKMRIGLLERVLVRSVLVFPSLSHGLGSTGSHAGCTSYLD